MTSEQFIEQCYKNRVVHAAVWGEASNRSKNTEVKEEYVQEAWLALSQAPPDLTPEAYGQIVRKVVKSAYDQECRISGRAAGYSPSEIEIERMPSTVRGEGFDYESYPPWQEAEEEFFDKDGLPMGVDGRPA